MTLDATIVIPLALAVATVLWVMFDQPTNGDET